MPSKIKNSLLITLIILLILCALPIYFVVNYQKQFNVHSASGSGVQIMGPTEIIDYDEADYFEYAQESNDPFYNSPTSSSTTISDNKFFLRKGQSLLLYKEEISNCGSLTELRAITNPRPAVLCKGKYVATIPNPQCSDSVEICEFELEETGGGKSKRYKIKEQVESVDCISTTKICLPSVIQNCVVKNSAGQSTTFDDAYKCDSSATVSLKCLHNDGSYSYVNNNVFCSSGASVIPTCPTGVDLFTLVSKDILFSAYKCIKTNLSICPNNMRILPNFEDLKKDPTQKPQFSGYNSTLIGTSQTCFNILTNPSIQEESLIKIDDNYDACYDLTNYTGKVEDIPIENTYESYVGFLNNSKNAKPIYNISSLSADKYFGNLDYSSSKNLFINENGEFNNLSEFQVTDDRLQMQVLFVNNTNLSSDFDIPPSFNGLRTKISFSQNQTYKNGQMLKVVLCKEDEAIYANTGKTYKLIEGSNTKCDDYLIESANKQEIITKTYNSLPSSSRSLYAMPNSLSDADYFLQDFPEAFSAFKPLAHKTDSIKVAPPDTAVANGVYDNTNQADRSPYMFDKNGWLKLMVAKEPRLLPISKLENSGIQIQEPICHNYDNNFYCHRNFHQAFPPKESKELEAEIKNWEKNQLKSDLSYRLAFQIDDPDISDVSVVDHAQYPNAISTPLNSDKIKKGNEAYRNNTGKYEITVKVTEPAKKAQLRALDKLDNLVDKLSLTEYIELYKPIGTKEDQAVESKKSMFSYLVAKDQLKLLVTVSAILMLGIFTSMYLMGLSKLDHQTLVSMILKIALVFGLLSPDAWELYNNIFALPVVKTFNELSYQTLMILLPEDLVETQTLPTFDKERIATYFYQSVDVITMILNQKNHFKIMAIFFSYSYGFVYIFIIYYGFYVYLFAIANAILMFILAKIIMVLLINILPLFLLCLFFKTTQKMLDNWFSLVLGYGFQQIFIIIAVAFFNIMIVFILKMILGYKVCWDSVLKINATSLGHGLPFEDIVFFKFWKVSDSENGSYIPSLFHILYFLILVYAMKHFINFAAGLGSRIAGGVSVESIATAIKGDITGNIASTIVLKTFNNLTKGMKNRLIDKVSFGYSGELAEARIKKSNEQIDNHREAFQDVQQQLNEYQSSSEFLALNDEQKDMILKTKANQLAAESGYDNYENLIKSANQSKQFSSTTVSGMLYEKTGSASKHIAGKATNAVIGRNLVTGIANDNGEFNEANLLGANRTISSKDVQGAQKIIDGEIEKLVDKAQQQSITEAEKRIIQNQIEQLEIQKELIKLKQNTWTSLDKFRSIANRHGIEVALTSRLFGAITATTSGVLGGVAGGVIGAAGGAVGGYSVGKELSVSKAPVRVVASIMGVPIGASPEAVAGTLAGIFGGVVGGARGSVRGAYSGVNANLKSLDNLENVKLLDNFAERSGNLIRGNVSMSTSASAISSTFSSLRRGSFASVGEFSEFAQKEFKTHKNDTKNATRNTYSAIGSGLSSAGSAIGSASHWVYSGATSGFPSTSSAIGSGFSSASSAAGSGANWAISAAGSGANWAISAAISDANWARSAAISGVNLAISGFKSGFPSTRSAIGSTIRSTASTIRSTASYIYSNPLNVASAVVHMPPYIAMSVTGKTIDAIDYGVSKINNTTFAKIARNDAKYNLQQKLKTAYKDISADKQEQIIDDFILNIHPYLSKNLNLDKLNSGYKTTDYQDQNIATIHGIIEESLAKLNKDKPLLNQDKSLFDLFVKLAKQQKNEGYVITNIANLTYSTFGAAIAGSAYAAGYTKQSMQNYLEESILQHKKQRASQAIDVLMNTLDESSQQKVRTLKQEIEQAKSKNINESIQDTIVKEVVTKNSTTKYTDKAKLLLALQEYAKHIN